MTDIGALLHKHNFLASPTASPRVLKAAVLDFQKSSGLKVDGVAGPVTTRYLELPRFCGLPDKIVRDATGLCRWPMKNPTVGVSGYTPGLDVAVQREAMATAFAEFASVSGFAPVLLAQNNDKRANIMLYVKNLGGRGGTLAQAQLPCGPVSAETELFLESDSQELWAVFDGPSTNGRVDWRRVFKHEALHNAGLDHGPSGNLMAPVYSDAIWTLREWDSAGLVTRYGPAVAAPPPSPTPGNYIETLRDKLALWVGESRYRVTKIAA